MRRFLLTPALLFGTALGVPALAQVAPPSATTPAAPAAPAPQAAPSDPVLARVNGAEIHMSDVAQAARAVPNAQSMQPQQLYPMVLDRLISMRAVADVARKDGLEKSPDVQRQIELSTDEVLSNVYLSHAIGPTITPQAIEAIYKQEYAGKPGAQEVHARHILVPTEAEAKKIIAELKGGGDFAKLAAKYSKEPGAAERGGDLGFFSRTDMVPEFAAAAFAMKPGQVSDTPVHTQFGWHVIKVEQIRTAPPPSLQDVQSDIRQKLVQEGVQKAVTTAVAQVKIERFNPDGSTARPTDSAEPPASK
jgi:peptidyl-prolyl cis-trans isomerase C